ncbi:hypothetical protein PVAND_008841 [Polypedilum vanderplanki]|uniref:Leucine rich repeat protein n=1 Tax=Polypedilum vanderplanki TaxID=319348 RepID=A0A9J6CBH5_POLVA|nr:hypothetical protein PVAND_008841 [Polypedilum vanderplanki]
MKLIFCILLIKISSIIVYSLKLTCDFKKSSLGKYQLHYKCIATDFDVQSSSQELNEILGTHKEDKTNADIDTLIIKDKIVKYLPKNMQQFLPNVIHLDLNNTGLKIINRNDMEMFPKLKHLYIRHNHIEELPYGLFDNNKQLQFINLNDNKIKQISPNIFDALSRLVSLNIERNICIDSFAMGDDEILKLKQQIQIQC